MQIVVFFLRSSIFKSTQHTTSFLGRLCLQAVQGLTALQIGRIVEIECELAAVALEESKIRNKS